MIRELTIVFPLFNEGKRLKKTFLQIKNFKRKIKKKNRNNFC